MSRNSGLLVPLILMNSQGGGTSGTVGLSSGGTGSSLSDPGADRILFWDESGNAVDWLSVGSGLSITGTTLSSTGLTQFTAAESTSSPNNTVYVDSFTAAGSTTNVDVAFIPKGTGALLAAIPDSSATGGNKRGANAVDWQTVRANANEVASGARSIILGGKNNRADGDDSLAGGFGNRAAGVGAVAFGDTCVADIGGFAVGYHSQAPGVFGTISIGTYCLAFGTSSVAIGYDCNATGDFCSARGKNSYTRGLTGVDAFGGAQRAAAGDRQILKGVHAATTTGTTATTLTDGAAAVGSTTVMVLPDNSVAGFSARVTARTAAGDVASWQCDATGKRGSGAGSTAIEGAVTVTAFGISAALSTCTVTIAADTTRGAIVVSVTGVAATTIYWTAKVELVQGA